ncbi:hypothetical protein F511_03766 [Dorcoceras hygrometricum]|uniref:Uncharacterized protein n=1 Tax=Dorcoceras hygrometricum TaxID=472368 RepID=A0A2Z7B548_9LAMI|nr:hypothetical protein F511_03766 [Dorcoceras hygrometricum]
MAPSAPRTRAAAALRMKQIALDNQDRTIRRLRAQLATERRGLATTKKELEETQVALEASDKVIAGLTEIGLSMSKKIEKMKVKKHQVRANHVECHQKFQARIHEAEDSMQAQHLIIEALVVEIQQLGRYFSSWPFSDTNSAVGRLATRIQQLAIRDQQTEKDQLRFAFTLKIQQMACAMIKPAGSHSYLESAGTSLKDNQQLEKQQAHAEKLVFVIEFLHRLKASAVLQIVTVRFHSSFVRNFQTSCIRVLAKVEYSCALEPSRFHLADHCLRKFRLNYLCSFKFCVALISLSLYESTGYSALWVTWCNHMASTP